MPGADVFTGTYVPRSGEQAGSVTAKQLPDIACRLVTIKAVKSNVGNVYVGASGVTKVNGADDATTGYELAAEQETGWLPVDNLNRLFIICDNAGDDITYIALQ